MLAQIYPRKHARFSSLPLLGPHVEGFVTWLHAQGYPLLPIRLRVSAMLRVEALLHRRRVRRIEDLTAAELLGMRPKHSSHDLYRSAVLRSLARYLGEQDVLARPVPTPREELVDAYRSHLGRVRGFAESTRTHHAATVSEWLTFLAFDGDTGSLRAVAGPEIEGFLRHCGPRLTRESLQHVVSHLRSFLRFLAGQGLVASGLDATIDTPRVYRGERLPRSLPWATVRAFLRAIDRSTAMGRRDYAMFLLVATYGLRTSEVAALRLDDVEWRARKLRVPRPKTQDRLVLPLTEEVGAALADYLRHGRPRLARREVFLRVRAPSGHLEPTAVTEAFQGWVRRSGLPIRYQGPHCLRHALAVHLLRQGASLPEIGGLLGHRSAEATGVYLRLHVEDLRDAALDLPQEARS
jgi:integrase/recombinase XerD